MKIRSFLIIVDIFFVRQSFVLFKDVVSIKIVEIHDKVTYAFFINNS